MKEDRGGAAQIPKLEHLIAGPMDRAAAGPGVVRVVLNLACSLQSHHRPHASCIKPKV
jgi:hypothetical protein